MPEQDPAPRRRYVVDFEPGIFGPFDNRDQADAWGYAYVAELVEAPITSWSVKTLHDPEPAS